MSFTNKVVIVTGGSAGIGATTVIQFAREGAKVVIVGRSEEKLQEVGKQCESLNADYLVVKADITNENDRNSIIEKTIGKYGQLDVLVNNAGILRHGCILDGGILNIFDDLINTNLKSLVVLTTLAAPYLIKTKGNVVNISSIAGVRVKSPGATAYSISKAGVDMFTIGAALELAKHGVRVNSINPGPVRTEIARTAGINDNIENWKDGSALGRISDPEEVADLVLFVASDKARGITGSKYICDNGCVIYRK